MEAPSTPMSPVTAATSQGNDSEKSKKRRQPRNSACMGCAQLKMKCIQTPNGKCERCNRMDRECVPAVPKPRKRRTQSNVGESEGIPLLEFAGPSASPAGPPPKFDPPESQQPTYQAERGALLARHDLSHTDSRSFTALFTRGLGNVSANEELLRGVDYNFVASSFTIFRQLVPYFPFVEILPGADVIAMVTSRPVLTLAVCTVASAAAPEVQGRLAQAFRYTLSSKVILGSERSIDVLTGLMVFLGFHHQYMSQHHVYQQLSLLAGMAADLGLYKLWPEPPDLASALERNRAFVGCYYLCGCVSATGFDKPSPLRWTSNLRRCAEMVANSGSLPSDRGLVALLELAHAIDDTEDSLREISEQQRPIPVAFVDFQIKAASQRLKALKREHQSLSGSLVFTAATIHIHQRRIRVGEAPDHGTLIQCACAIKEYVDDVLARPPVTIHRFSIVDWSSLLEILILMARVSKPLPTATGWESGAITEMLKPGAFLDSLVSHMAAAPFNDPLSSRSESLIRLLKNASDGIKRQILFDGAPGQADDGSFRAVNEQGGLRAAPRPDFLGTGVLDTTIWQTLIGE
ncbi:Transcription factor himD [Pseudocercospora fuligena]|uniref:Transcription factor himD n=1 Tax=Pseudocercospora fuligena TaxID=685502 RepID=A0A8H6RB79_9PEZI|nr:Transcription factor himD [Pseudocercospora fuligena]